MQATSVKQKPVISARQAREMASGEIRAHNLAVQDRLKAWAARQSVVVTGGKVIWAADGRVPIK